jgi:hypothetical protein
VRWTAQGEAEQVDMSVDGRAARVTKSSGEMVTVNRDALREDPHAQLAARRVAVDLAGTEATGIQPLGLRPQALLPGQPAQLVEGGECPDWVKDVSACMKALLEDFPYYPGVWAICMAKHAPRPLPGPGFSDPGCE